MLPRGNGSRPSPQIDAIERGAVTADLSPYPTSGVTSVEMTPQPVTSGIRPATSTVTQPPVGPALASPNNSTSTLNNTTNSASVRRAASYHSPTGPLNATYPTWRALFLDWGAYLAFRSMGFGAWLRSQWTLWMTIVVVIVAYIAPLMTTNELLTTLSVTAVFFLSGLSLPLHELLQVRRHLPAFALASAHSFVVSPIVAVLCGYGIPLSANIAKGWLLSGLLCVSVLPQPTMLSALSSRAAGGSETFSMCLSASGNLLGAVASPLILQILIMAVDAAGLIQDRSELFGGHSFVPFLLHICSVVLLPLVVGLALQYLLTVRHLNAPHTQLHKTSSGDDLISVVTQDKQDLQGHIGAVGSGANVVRTSSFGSSQPHSHTNSPSHHTSTSHSFLLTSTARAYIRKAIFGITMLLNYTMFSALFRRSGRDKVIIAADPLAPVATVAEAMADAATQLLPSAVDPLTGESAIDWIGVLYITAILVAMHLLLCASAWFLTSPSVTGGPSFNTLSTTDGTGLNIATEYPTMPPAASVCKLRFLKGVVSNPEERISLFFSCAQKSDILAITFVSVTFASSSQSAALAKGLTGGNNDASNVAVMLVPALMYHLIQSIVGSLLAYPLRQWRNSMHCRPGTSLLPAKYQKALSNMPIFGGLGNSNRDINANSAASLLGNARHLSAGRGDSQGSNHPSARLHPSIAGLNSASEKGDNSSGVGNTSGNEGGLSPVLGSPLNPSAQQLYRPQQPPNDVSPPTLGLADSPYPQNPQQRRPQLATTPPRY